MDVLFNGPPVLTLGQGLCNSASKGLGATPKLLCFRNGNNKKYFEIVPTHRHSGEKGPCKVLQNIPLFGYVDAKSYDAAA